MYSLKTLLSSTGAGSVKCCTCPTPLIYLMGVTTKKKYLASFAYLSITITYRLVFQISHSILYYECIFLI